MTNEVQVRKLIAQKGLKLNFIASKLNITPYGLSLKLSNKNDFRSKEIATMCDILGIEDLEVKEGLFFAKSVDL